MNDTLIRITIELEDQHIETMCEFAEIELIPKEAYLLDEDGKRLTPVHLSHLTGHDFGQYIDIEATPPDMHTGNQDFLGAVVTCPTTGESVRF